MQADARVTGYGAATIVAVEVAVALAKKTYIRNNPYERKAFIDARPVPAGRLVPQPCPARGRAVHHRR